MREIVLHDGRSLSDASLSRDIEVSFDGRNELHISTTENEFYIDAKTPSILSASPNDDIILLNYGNGSGQVYNIEAYDTASGNMIDFTAFHEELLRFSQIQSHCSLSLDQISLVFSKWVQVRQIEIRTEDFSRTMGCEAINRVWLVSI